jgi:hypothetical protein
VRRLLPLPVLNFVAGLFAGAGINLLTTVATAPPGTAASGIVVDSALWVVTAGTATWLGHVEAGVDAAVADRTSPRLSLQERNSVRDHVRAEPAIRRRLWLATAATGVSLVLSLLLLPRIGPMSW